MISTVRKNSGLAPNGRLLILIALVLNIGTINCFQATGSKNCFEQAISDIVQQDNEKKLISLSQLLIVINFSHNGSFKGAVVPIELFPIYLIDEDNVMPLGCYIYDDLNIAVFGRKPQFLKSSPCGPIEPFLVPYDLADNAVPKDYPPMVVEPLVYTFRKGDYCYELIDKNIATKLFDKID